MGMSDLSIAVLRCAEVLACGTGSQLWDYLQSRVCLRPLGFNPMINVLSIADCVAALILAAAAPGSGIYNIPGADTLPLSRITAGCGRADVPVPGPLLSPLYQLRTWTVGLEFRYDLNLRRFHFGGVVDGARARQVLGYQPCHPIRWADTRPAHRTERPDTSA
jgi:nucleoside-diphosphate-sugar epimerase